MTSSEFDLRKSFGALLQTTDGLKFDARIGPADFPGTTKSSHAPALGYNASALFGVLHHLSSWFPDNGDSQSPPGINHVSIREYIENEILAQFSDVVDELNRDTHLQVERIANYYPPAQLRFLRPSDGDVIRPAACLFEFASAESAAETARLLSANGILVTVRGSTIGIQLNLGFRDEAITEFWKRFEYCWKQIGLQSESRLPPNDLKRPLDVEANYEFHHLLLRLKKKAALQFSSDFQAKNEALLKREPLPFSLSDWFDALPAHLKLSDLQLIRLDKDSFADFRSRILELQKEIYEPARQSPPEEFDTLFATGKAIGIVILDGDQIVGKAFAGPLAAFTSERGVLSDPYLHDPSIFYSMDLTVIPAYRRGLGKILKRAVLLQAIADGVTAVHGRNRDRVARGMWAINLSLGAYRLQHLIDDYPDEGPYRDCIYYRCPLANKRPPSQSRASETTDARSHATAGWANLPGLFELRLPNLVNGV